VPHGEREEKRDLEGFRKSPWDIIVLNGGDRQNQLERDREGQGQWRSVDKQTRNIELAQKLKL